MILYQILILTYMLLDIIRVIQRTLLSFSNGIIPLVNGMIQRQQLGISQVRQPLLIINLIFFPHWITYLVDKCNFACTILVREFLLTGCT